MPQREIFITQFDKDRLEELISVAEAFSEHSRKDLQSLRGELERATIVSPHEVPADVVTMNSRVLLRDVESSKEMTVTLVFPKDADLSAGRLSVLAPVGMAILGYREGMIVEWRVPAGVTRLSIEKILYQPESSGDYDR